MIGVNLQKKLTALFLNSCLMTPIILVSIIVTITPIVSAESACDVPASNNWVVSDKTNIHQLDNNWLEETDLEYPVISDFSMEIELDNDSATAVSMILTTGKSYTFCYSFYGDPENPPSNGAKGDVYLMTEGNWDFYGINYELRFENWMDEVGFLPVEYRDTITWMPFRDVHTYEKVSSGYFSVSIDTETSSWFSNNPTEYFLVFDNWNNNHKKDAPAAGGELNVELLVDVEDRFVLPKFTAYVLVAILPLSCLIVPFIINSKYQSYGLENIEQEEREVVPILEKQN
jgi:hypothetical protein